jgi:hypothetical protein
VRTPDQAVMFAKRYGLLRSTPYDPHHWSAGREGRHFGPDEEREPFEIFERHAEDLRQILRTVLDVRKASGGDKDALTRLRERFVRADGEILRYPARHVPRSAPKSDVGVLRIAMDWAGDGLRAGMNMYDRVSVLIFDPSSPPGEYDAQTEESEDNTRYASTGQIEVAAFASSLLGFCYLNVAQELATQVRLEVCPECARVFVVEDSRQRFCEPACANRARFRRFAIRRKEQQQS